MNHKAKHVAKGALFLVAAAAMGGVVMALWNYVVPIAFAGGQVIDYWHALGLLVLTRILFGGFRGHGHGGWHGRREQWDKWQAMTKEERAQFIELSRASHRHPWGGRGDRGDRGEPGDRADRADRGVGRGRGAERSGTPAAPPAPPAAPPAPATPE